MLVSRFILLVVLFLSGGDALGFMTKGCNSRCTSKINAAGPFDSHKEITSSSSRISSIPTKVHSSSKSPYTSSSTTPPSPTKSLPSSSSSSSTKLSGYLSKFMASAAVSVSVLIGTMPQHSMAAAGGSAGSPALEAKIKQLETSNTVQSLADLFEASGQNTLKARTRYKYRIVKAINDQRSKLTNDKVEWDQTLRYESGELKRRVDPFRTVDLKGYLQIAPAVGGVAYLSALFVQQVLPELFIFAYPLAAVAFVAPIVFIIVFG